MEELIKYLQDNKIEFNPIDNDFISIAGKRYFLVIPDEEGTLFSEDFVLKANQLKCDRYVYRFGGNWYYEDIDKYDKPELNDLKYLGKTMSPLVTDNFLGVRGGYEILNGSRLYNDWVKKAKFLGVKSLGICEKNTLAGVLKFQLECQKNDIKPIIGATYTVFRVKEDFRYDIKVFVKDEQGWENILLINKEVLVLNKGYITEERFSELIEGLFIVVDPKCLEFGQLGKLNRLFKFDYYQLDTVNYLNENRDKDYLLNLKKFVRSDYKPVGITDTFYLDKEDSYIKKTLNTMSNSMEYESDNQYFKDTEDYYNELEILFNKDDESFYDVLTEALNNSNAITRSCDFTVQTGLRHLPKYKMTKAESEVFSTNEDLFWALIEKGLSEKIKDNYDVYLDRIEKEFKVIKKGDVVDYFLILWDIINWARNKGILVGQGRGSAAGCLISYLIGITNVDPLDFDLLFERFLNEGRIVKSLPDIDVDFQSLRREEVKSYMEYRYGANQVCSVGTYTAMQVKAVIKDLGRQYGVNFGDINQITTLLSNNLKNFKDLFVEASKNGRIKAFIKDHSDIINDIKLILHQPKARSIHACAVLILPEEKDMFRWIPITNIDGQMVSEWEGPELEQAGFLKEDILGIRQLDKFNDIVRLVKENKDIDIDLYNIPLDDEKVYEYFKKGWNGDVFHFGSKGLTGYCKELLPDNIDDLIAGISLYRPGSMENNFHNEYVLRKYGKREVEYWTGTEDILNKTYAVIVYQEQIMKLCNVLGGLSLVEADDVRKSMVKKKYDELKKYKDRFIPYYVKNFNVTQEYSENVWDAIDKASLYLFNKCISGNEFIRSTGVPFKYSIRDTFRLKNDKIWAKEMGLLSMYGKLNGPRGFGYSWSLSEDGRLYKNKIKDIRFQGIKSLYRITLSNGKTIDTTANHKFPTNNGEKIVSDLSVENDKLYYCIGYVQDWVEESFTDKGKNYDCNNPYSFKYKLNSEKGKEGFQKRDSNFTKLRYYKINLKKDYCENCFIKHNRLEVHHKNGNHIDNCEENLMTVCPSCHKKFHYQDLGRIRQGGKGLFTNLVSIISVEYIGKEDVYDVEMEGPNHTFTTSNGIVTCNSHAAAYSITGYISQWLKVHYPLEYWSIAFKYASESDYALYINEINNSGNIKVLPADINLSRNDVYTDFNSKTIYWPLNSIRQCGDKSSSQIIELRDKDGQYFSFEEFIQRNKFKGSKVTKQVVENLILSGAFDNIENIKTYNDRLKLILEYRVTNKIKIDSKKDLITLNNSNLHNDWWWLLQQKILSGISFFPYEYLLDKYLDTEGEILPIEEIQSDKLADERAKVKIGGYVVDFEERSSKKGYWCRFRIESNYTFVYVTIWSDIYEDLKETIDLCTKTKCLILMNGEVSYDNYKKENCVQSYDKTKIVILENFES